MAFDFEKAKYVFDNEGKLYLYVHDKGAISTGGNKDYHVYICAEGKDRGSSYIANDENFGGGLKPIDGFGKDAYDIGYVGDESITVLKTCKDETNGSYFIVDKRTKAKLTGLFDIIKSMGFFSYAGTLVAFYYDGKKPGTVEGYGFASPGDHNHVAYYRCFYYDGKLLKGNPLDNNFDKLLSFGVKPEAGTEFFDKNGDLSTTSDEVQPDDLSKVEGFKTIFLDTGKLFFDSLNFIKAIKNEKGEDGYLFMQRLYNNSGDANFFFYDIKTGFMSKCTVPDPKNSKNADKATIVTGTKSFVNKKGEFVDTQESLKDSYFEKCFRAELGIKDPTKENPVGNPDPEKLEFKLVEHEPIIKIKMRGGYFEKGIHLTDITGNEHYFYHLEEGQKSLIKLHLGNKVDDYYPVNYEKIFNEKECFASKKLESIVGPCTEIRKLFGYDDRPSNLSFCEGTGAIAGRKGLYLNCVKSGYNGDYFYDFETGIFVKCDKPTHEEEKENKINCTDLANNVLNRETGKFELSDLNDPKALNIEKIPLIYDWLKNYITIWKLKLELGDPLVVNGTGAIAGRRGFYLKGNGDKNYFWDLENNSILVECDAKPNGKEIKCENLKCKIFNEDTGNFDLDDINAVKKIGYLDNFIRCVYPELEKTLRENERFLILKLELGEPLIVEGNNNCSIITGKKGIYLKGKDYSNKETHYFYGIDDGVLISCKDGPVDKKMGHEDDKAIARKKEWGVLIPRFSLKDLLKNDEEFKKELQEYPIKNIEDIVALKELLAPTGALTFGKFEVQNPAIIKCDDSSIVALKNREGVHLRLGTQDYFYFKAKDVFIKCDAPAGGKVKIDGLAGKVLKNDTNAISFVDNLDDSNAAKAKSFVFLNTLIKDEADKIKDVGGEDENKDKDKDKNKLMLGEVYYVAPETTDPNPPYFVIKYKTKDNPNAGEFYVDAETGKVFMKRDASTHALTDSCKVVFFNTDTVDTKWLYDNNDTKHFLDDHFNDFRLEEDKDETFRVTAATKENITTLLSNADMFYIYMSRSDVFKDPKNFYFSINGNSVDKKIDGADYYVLEFNTLLAGKEKVAMSKTGKKLYKLDEINNKLGDEIKEAAVKNKVINKLVAEKKDKFGISLSEFDKNKKEGYIFFKALDAYGQENYFYLSLDDYQLYKPFGNEKTFNATMTESIDLDSEPGKIKLGSGIGKLTAEIIEKLPGLKEQLGFNVRSAKENKVNSKDGYSIELQAPGSDGAKTKVFLSKTDGFKFFDEGAANTQKIDTKNLSIVNAADEANTSKINNSDLKFIKDYLVNKELIRFDVEVIGNPDKSFDNLKIGSSTKIAAKGYKIKLTNPIDKSVKYLYLAAETKDDFNFGAFYEMSNNGNDFVVAGNDTPKVKGINGLDLNDAASSIFDSSKEILKDIYIKAKDKTEFKVEIEIATDSTDINGKNLKSVTFKVAGAKKTCEIYYDTVTTKFFDKALKEYEFNGSDFVEVEKNCIFLAKDLNMFCNQIKIDGVQKSPVDLKPSVLVYGKLPKKSDDNKKAVRLVNNDKQLEIYVDKNGLIFDKDNERVNLDLTNDLKAVPWNNEGELRSLRATISNINNLGVVGEFQIWFDNAYKGYLENYEVEAVGYSDYLAVEGDTENRKFVLINIDNKFQKRVTKLISVPDATVYDCLFIGDVNSRVYKLGKSQKLSIETNGVLKGALKFKDTNDVNEAKLDLNATSGFNYDIKQAILEFVSGALSTKLEYINNSIKDSEATDENKKPHKIFKFGYSLVGVDKYGNLVKADDATKFVEIKDNKVVEIKNESKVNVRNLDWMKDQIKNLDLVKNFVLADEEIKIDKDGKVRINLTDVCGNQKYVEIKRGTSGLEFDTKIKGGKFDDTGDLVNINDLNVVIDENSPMPLAKAIEQKADENVKAFLGFISNQNKFELENFDILRYNDNGNDIIENGCLCLEFKYKENGNEDAIFVWIDKGKKIYGDASGSPITGESWSKISFDKNSGFCFDDEEGKGILDFIKDKFGVQESDERYKKIVEFAKAKKEFYTQVYGPKNLKSKFEVKSVKAGKSKVGEKTDIDGVVFEIKGTDKKTVKVFTPDEEDALYNEQGKKVRLDETTGNVLELKEGEENAGEENKLSNSELLLEAILRNNVAPKSVAAELESIEEKTIKDDSVKIAKQESGEENVQLEIKRRIAQIKNKNGKYIYFDLFTLKETDENGDFIGDKISEKEIGKRFVSFGEGDKTEVYDISGLSLAEKINGVYKILLGEKSDYKELLKIDADAGLKLLGDIYNPTEAKKMIDGFERFARDYNLFDENNKLNKEEAKKLFGEKFFIRTATGYVPLSIGALSGVGAGALAALVFSGTVVFPFAAPALIATLVGLSGVSATGWIMFITDAIRTAIIRNRYIDKKSLGQMAKAKKESKSVLSKIRKPEESKGKEKKGDKQQDKS